MVKKNYLRKHLMQFNILQKELSKQRVIEFFYR